MPGGEPLSSPNTDICLVCFSTVVPKSLENVDSRDQIDLQEDRATMDRFASNKKAPISSGVRWEPAKQMGDAKCLECSSLFLDYD